MIAPVANVIKKLKWLVGRSIYIEAIPPTAGAPLHADVVHTDAQDWALAAQVPPDQ